MRILLIEDNAELAINVGDYLALRGHQMDYAGDGLTGLHLCVTQHYDAVVLDVGLPGLDGVTLCRKLRGEAALTLPVLMLMLTARDTLDDKVTGLDAGADDYLVKPFALRELEARLNALARRSDSGGHRRRLQVGDLSLDLDTQTARRGTRELKLTPTGFKLLEERRHHAQVARQRGLGPHQQVDTEVRLAERRVALQRRYAHLRQPLLILRHVALHQRHAQWRAGRLRPRLRADAVAAGDQPVISQDHRVVRAEITRQAGALGFIDRNALVIVVGDAIVELHAALREGQGSPPRGRTPPRRGGCACE